MKINSNLVNSAYQNSINLKDRVIEGPKTTAKKVENTDKVLMSASAISASVVSQASKKVSEDLSNAFSEEKIMAFKEAVGNGSYEINPEKIADALIQHSWEA